MVWQLIKLKLWRIGMWKCRHGMHHWTIKSWREPYRLNLPLRLGGRTVPHETWGVLMITGLRCKRCDVPQIVKGLND